jgi:diguanylate cyclase (GGDEF)-like protein
LVAAGDHRQLVMQELASLEAQHPDIGALLAQRWKLPEDLIAPVKYHERPTAAPAENAPLVRCVALGNTAHDALTDEYPAEAMRLFYLRGEKWFGFDRGGCEAILRKITESTRQLSGLFRLETGAYPDADQVIDRAQEHLASLNEQSFRLASAARPELETVLADSEEFDPLTGVLAAGAGAAHAEVEFEAARTSGQAFTILKVYLDRFESVVRKLGIEAGDALLFETGALLQQQFESKGGRVCRAGESVFDVIVRGLDRVGAVKAASELRELIRTQSAGWTLPGADPTRMTASVGVATMEPAGPIQFSRVQQLVNAGERALEAASRSGGDCIRAFVPRAAA